MEEKDIEDMDLEAVKEEKKLERELPDHVKETNDRAKEQPTAGGVIPLIRERL